LINKIDFKAKNLKSNAGLFLLLENAKSNGIFELIENVLVFDNDSIEKLPGFLLKKAEIKENLFWRGI
jgi:hypothetical protein